MAAPTAGNHRSVRASGVRAPPTTVRKPSALSTVGSSSARPATTRNARSATAETAWLTRRARRRSGGRARWGRAARGRPLRTPRWCRRRGPRGRRRAAAGSASRSGWPATQVPSESTARCLSSIAGRRASRPVGALDGDPVRRSALAVHFDPRLVVGVVRVDPGRGEVGDRCSAPRTAEPLGHQRLARTGAAEHERDHGWTSSPATTACGRPGRRGHPRRSGPANGSTGSVGGQQTTMASEAVPVPGTPASNRAWVLASVAVMTALTAAAGRQRHRDLDDELIVPGRHPDVGPHGVGVVAVGGPRRPGHPDRGVDHHAAVLAANRRGRRRR